MYNLVLFGGSGGLGKELYPILREKYNVISLSSSDINVTNLETVVDFFDKVDAQIVLNMSGYNSNIPIHKYTVENQKELKKQLTVNIEGTYNILSACLPKMRLANYGRIILTSSVLSTMPVFGASIYSACKAAIDSLARSCSLENSSKGITCNSLQLGYFNGGMLYTIPKDFRETIRKNIPTQRWGTIEEIANTVNYLVDTPYVTGTSLAINGGITY